MATIWDDSQLHQHTPQDFSPDPARPNSHLQRRSFLHNYPQNSWNPPPPPPPSTISSIRFTDPTAILISSETPPFEVQKNFAEITNEHGLRIVPTITCRIYKGFLLDAENNWTCYRRNDFGVEVAYSLQPILSPHQLSLSNIEANMSSKNFFKVQSLALFLEATTLDHGNAMSVRIHQRKSKRANKPWLEIEPVVLEPAAAAQSTQDSPRASQTVGTLATSHTFERVQFKRATANNGKYRTQQQYFALEVSLLADIQKDPGMQPQWIKLAGRRSEPLVVRGRTPRNYQHDLTQGASSSRSSPAVPYSFA